GELDDGHRSAPEQLDDLPTRGREEPVLCSIGSHFRDLSDIQQRPTICGCRNHNNTWFYCNLGLEWIHRIWTLLGRGHFWAPRTDPVVPPLWRLFIPGGTAGRIPR